MAGTFPRRINSVSKDMKVEKHKGQRAESR